jgi:hypothetical protein
MAEKSFTASVHLIIGLGVKSMTVLDKCLRMLIGGSTRIFQTTKTAWRIGTRLCLIGGKE